MCFAGETLLSHLHPSTTLKNNNQPFRIVGPRITHPLVARSSHTLATLVHLAKFDFEDARLVCTRGKVLAAASPSLP